MTSKARGFTLIEVVVSITILSLIVLATVTAMRTLANTQERLEQKAEQSSQMQMVVRYLRKTLSDAQSITWYKFGAPAGQYFYGDESYVQVVSPLAIAGRTGGLWTSHLSVKEGRLVLKLISGLQLPDWSGDGLSYVLLSNIDAFSIAYRSNRYSEWVSDWDGLDEKPDLGIPSHVKIKLKVAGRYWPDIIVAMNPSRS
ncbi:prepilin-type N-terminal cleavage/methylation domain-containing protein [uncultured Gilvimarinus sp.]|uniref:prepilin-type N-terminal cleavage/methylation domain-containing protein n=1 Tax=uncultured Gilvimarinus sp. TaxID=1689143 RepID=UPI0030DBB14F